ncbi:MAG: iron-sulfur cluster assembly scaffold protein [Promicromonosporaceae bacterium]|nr:iron-sulfur cluster assembly scaffold protein [Promicromonosporaceae bacterium]
MYQQVILDHAKRPHGLGLAPCADLPSTVTGESHQVNPTCGDEITLRAVLAAAAGAETPGAAAAGSEAPGLEAPGRVLEAVTWEGQGCSISQASASIMTDLVTGLPLAEVTHLQELFSALMGSRGLGLDSEEEMDLLDDATAFTGTSKYPARIKCALLGWMALKDAVRRAQEPGTGDAGGRVAP